MRFDERTHLGLGDIRLTIDQQENIVSLFESLESRNVMLQEVLVRTAQAIDEYLFDGTISKDTMQKLYDDIGVTLDACRAKE
jgi:hypothetical protein